MFDFPKVPELPETQRTTRPVSLRYEDVAQDGRLLSSSVPHALGEVIWYGLLRKHEDHRKLGEAGIIPILSRMVVESFEGPTAVKHALEGEGGFDLGHTTGDDGAPNRVLLDMWCDVFGEKSRQWGPPPEGAGSRVLLGRVFAEHVFTRLFAAPDQRKVTKLDGAKVEVPPRRRAWTKPESLLEIPSDAIALDAEARPDSSAIPIGLSATDSNQHVNSLAYPRFFEEAALRRFDELGKSVAMHPRFVECAYRKPTFAGERVRFRLRAFDWKGRLGATGTLFDDRGKDDKPRCFVRMLF